MTPTTFIFIVPFVPLMLTASIMVPSDILASWYKIFESSGLADRAYIIETFQTPGAAVCQSSEDAPMDPLVALTFTLHRWPSPMPRG